MRLIDDAERRARIARRQALAPQHRVTDACVATRAMTVLHATEPATPYLSLFARIDSFTRAELDDALFESRSLVKQLAMRRTLFVFPRDLLPAAVSSACARVAQQEHSRLVKDLEGNDVADDGPSWLATARAAVLRRLDDGAELSAKELREGLVELAGQVSLATSISPRTSRPRSSTRPATAAPPPGGTARSSVPTCRTTPGRSS